MQFLETSKFIFKTIFENFAIKLLIVLILILWFSATIGHVHANVKQQANQQIPGVCVFDIDFTLSCDGAAAAVQTCKDAGFKLAIDTARSYDDAWKVVTDGTLLAKGFGQDFVDEVMQQQGIDGPFQYSGISDPNQPTESSEQDRQGKSYGMRNIARYYGFKLDDIESRKLILFDDLFTNIMQVQPSWYDQYSKSRCYAQPNGECYFDPASSPSFVKYPRNWKIYTGKFIDTFCTSWNNEYNAAYDAQVAIDNVLNQRREYVD